MGTIAFDAMRDETDEQSEQTPIDDLDLECPQCQYSLRGLTSDRCPECGELLDWDRLRCWATDHDLHPTFGPRSSGEQESIFWMSLFQPSRLGRELPARMRPGPVDGYGWAMRVIAVAMLGIIGLCIEGPDLGVRLVLLVAPAVILGSMLTEYLTALVVATHVQGRWLPSDFNARELYWRHLCAFFSSYLVCSHAAISLICLGASVHRSGLLVTLLLPVICLCWWFALGRAIAARSVPTTARTIVFLCIPVIAGFAFFIGVLICWCIGMAAEACYLIP